MYKHAELKEAHGIADKLWDDCKNGRLSKIGIDEVRVRCLGYTNYDWLVNKVLRLVITKVG